MSENINMQQFYAGPKGSNFVISAIFNNTEKLKEDLEMLENSPNPLGSFVMISYNSLPGDKLYDESLVTDEGINYNSAIFVKKLLSEEEWKIIKSKEEVNFGRIYSIYTYPNISSAQMWVYEFISSSLGQTGKGLEFQGQSLNITLLDYQIEPSDEPENSRYRKEQFTDDIAFENFISSFNELKDEEEKISLDNIEKIKNGYSYCANFILYKNYQSPEDKVNDQSNTEDFDTDNEKIVISYFFIRNNKQYQKENNIEQLNAPAEELEELKNYFTISKIMGTFSSLEGLTNASVYDRENNQVLIGANFENKTTKNAFVFGENLLRDNNQIVFGQFNTNNPEDKNILIFGNGEGNDNRNNLLTIDENGDIKINGEESELSKRVSRLENTALKLQFPEEPEGKFLMDDGTWQYPTNGIAEIRCYLLNGKDLQNEDIEWEKIELYSSQDSQTPYITLEYEASSSSWIITQSNSGIENNKVDNEISEDEDGHYLPINVEYRGTWTINFYPSETGILYDGEYISRELIINNLSFNTTDISDDAIYSVASVYPNFEDNTWDLIIAACENELEIFTNDWQVGDYIPVFPGTTNNKPNYPLVNESTGTSKDRYLQDIFGYVIIMDKKHDTLIANFGNNELEDEFKNGESVVLPNLPEEGLRIDDDNVSTEDVTNKFNEIKYNSQESLIITNENKESLTLKTAKITFMFYGLTDLKGWTHSETKESIYKAYYSPKTVNNNKYVGWCQPRFGLSGSNSGTALLVHDTDSKGTIHSYSSLKTPKTYVYSAKSKSVTDFVNSGYMNDLNAGKDLLSYFLPTISNLEGTKIKSYPYNGTRFCKDLLFQNFELLFTDYYHLNASFTSWHATMKINSSTPTSFFFAENWANRIKPVIKKSAADTIIGSTQDAGTVSSVHYVYTPSLKEIVGDYTMSNYSESENDENTQFKYFENNWALNKNKIKIHPRRDIEALSHLTLSLEVSDTRSWNLGTGQQLEIINGKVQEIEEIPTNKNIQFCFCF